AQPDFRPSRTMVGVGSPSKTSRVPPENLALAELEALAGALLPVLLALLHARIARQKAVLAKARAQFRIEQRQRGGKAHAPPARLSAYAAALPGCDDVHGSGGLGELHRFDRAIAPGHIAKIFIRRPAVDGDLARPERQKDAGNGFLAPARSVKSLFCTFQRLRAGTQLSSSD